MLKPSQAPPCSMESNNVLEKKPNGAGGEGPRKSILLQTQTLSPLPSNNNKQENIDRSRKERKAKWKISD